MPGTSDRIAQETILLPQLIAEAVIGELCRYLDAHSQDSTVLRMNEWAAWLVERAENIYARNQAWCLKVKGGKKGSGDRDFLACFMRHWTAGRLQKTHPSLFQALPSAFANGEPLR